MLCFVLLPVLPGLWGFSDTPVATPVSRVSAELIAPDVLAKIKQPVLLSARLVKTRFFMQTGLGGESVEFLVDGTSIGQTMTGGDGWARKEFISKKKGVLKLTVRLAHGKRVKAQSSTATIESIHRIRPIVLVELEAAMEHVETSKSWPFDFLGFGQTQGIFPQPMPGSAEALTAVSKRASLLYLLVGKTSQSPEIHEWLAEHAFPSGPVFMIHAGTRVLVSKIEGWKDEGWKNIKAGITRNAYSVVEYVDQELHAVMVLDEGDEEDVPEEAIVVSEWHEITTLKALRFK